jgi:hypothetical protein
MMRGMSPGAALRELQQAHAGLRKARELLKQARNDPRAVASAFDAGWESLSVAHRLMAGIPREATDDAVLTKQLAVERYATALLVRLRRLKRHEGADPGVVGDLDDSFDGEDHED